MSKYDHSPARRETPRKLTSNQEEWKHQITNLKRRIRELEKKGYYVPESLIPEQPKRITKKAIADVKAIKRKQLLEVSIEKQGPEVPPEPPVDTVDVELYMLYSFIENYTNPNANQFTLEGARSHLLQLLDEAIIEYGRREIAIRAEEMANARGLAQQAMDESNSDRQRASIDGFSHVLFGRAFSQAELIAIQRDREGNENFELPL